MIWIYLAELLYNLQTFCIIITGCIAMYWVFSKFFNATNSHHFEEGEEAKINAKNNKLLKVALILFFIGCFLPSKSTSYIMLGAYYLKDSNIPPKVEALIHKKLDELLMGKK